jgi:hypothetical protein
MRRVVRPAGIDDVKFFLVRRERNAVRLDEVIDDDLEIAGFRVDPVDVMLLLLRLGFDTLIVAANPVDRISEPGRTVRCYDGVVR